MFRLRVNGHSLKNFIHEGTVYLPDFIIYDMDEEDYQSFWHSIAGHPKEQLYTDGVQIYRVSWLQSLFQRFKGWLGFENHCHPKKVDFTLAKVAYIGYLHGFKSEDFAQFNPPLISKSFMDSLLKKRNDQTTTELQHQFITYFYAHSTEIAPYLNYRQQNYRFGDGFLQNELLSLIPTLDPQNAELIRDSTHSLYDKFLYPAHAYFFAGSKYAEAYADYLASRAQFERALMWSDSVTDRYKQGFINYYIALDDQNALEKSIELMDKLSQSPSTQDQLFVIEALKENFSKDEQLRYLKAKPKLRHELAKSYLEDARKEKNKWVLTKIFTGNNLLPLLTHAVNLDDSILEHDSLMNDMTLKKEWITYQFKEDIKHKRLEHARELYEKNPEFQFNSTDLGILLEHYETELETTEKKLKSNLVRSNTEEARQLAEQALHFARQIAKLSPEDNPLRATMNTYVQSLLEVDIKEHPNVKEASLPDLAKLLQFIKENQFFNQSPDLKKTGNDVRLRAIDCLIEKVRVPLNFTSDFRSRPAIVKEKEKYLQLLLLNLETFEKLNFGDKSPQIKLALGRIYYLQADIRLFFYEDEKAALPLFQKAHETVPTNLYYKLKYYELTKNEARFQVIQDIDSLDYLQHAKYIDWQKERWNEELFMSVGFNIHAAPQVKAKSLSNLFGLF
ncbi:hypothetical protein [Legionella waltersii]|uniref:Uncharacterized protein n=1 Tax=Legionella waltersii TaxID=66969 RepID=A0A0W1A318_9GAMM|nr:hypothetical protein [Legionella waltersii]KTD75688.1 hypothetical protein Lwal_2626 [Legionella waltersii]SNU99368.1 Uncharacterised protein [Legionella waltersii]